MAELSCRFLIDPALERPGPEEPDAVEGTVVPLIEDGGEYCVAVARTADLPAYRVLPDAVCLDLYAYELLERMRERLAARAARAERNPEPPGPGRAAPETWVLPLWPASLYAAAGHPVHAGREILACYPRPDRIEVWMRDASVTERALRRCLGRIPGDLQAYQDDLANRARTCGWSVHEGGDAGTGGLR